MKKLIALIFGTGLISACAASNKGLITRVDKIDFYAMPLITTTKLPINKDLIADSAYYLCKIKDPDSFLLEINSVLAHTKAQGANSEFDDVRMLYQNFTLGKKNGQIAIDKGGEHIWYDGKIYAMNEKISSVIAKYLPSSDMTASSLERRYYKKENYIPMHFLDKYN
jgi:hypothetical protein